ncbi:Uaa transporter, partial [Thalictrum thalictroides]
MEIERRITRKPPAMLKEFLRDDFSSCSSSGFRSFPRRSCYTSVRNLLELDLKARDYSRKIHKKEVKITAFQKATMAMINVVKHFQFSQKQSILPRSLSRRLKRSFTKKSDKAMIKREMSVVVKVKDILKWKSFKDASIEEKKKPLDCSASPIIIQTNITRTTTTTTTSSNSWSDSDFTSEYLHSWSCSSENSHSGENEIEECNKKYLPEKKKISKTTSCTEVVEDSMEKSRADSKCEDKDDQFSPVSVLDFPFEEDDESSSSSFQSSLENME